MYFAWTFFPYGRLYCSSLQYHAVFCMDEPNLHMMSVLLHSPQECLWLFELRHLLCIQEFCSGDATYSCWQVDAAAGVGDAPEAARNPAEALWGLLFALDSVLLWIRFFSNYSGVYSRCTFKSDAIVSLVELRHLPCTQKCVAV